MFLLGSSNFSYVQWNDSVDLIAQHIIFTMHVTLSCEFSMLRLKYMHVPMFLCMLNYAYIKGYTCLKDHRCKSMCVDNASQF